MQERFRGDTSPITLTIPGTDGPVDLTGCTDFILTADSRPRPADELTQLFSLAGTVTDAVNGVVEFIPATIQTDYVGVLYFDVQYLDARGLLTTGLSSKIKFIQDIGKTLIPDYVPTETHLTALSLITQAVIDAEAAAVAAQTSGSAVALAASLAASSGASQVGYTPAGTGAVPTTVQSKLRESVSVKDFGVVGNGVADDTAAISLAIATGAKTIKFTPGTYLITSSLTQAESQAWIGEGGQRATTLKKMFNGDLLTMGTLGELSNLNFDGNGATYSGKNIIVPVGCFSPRITRCRSTNSLGVGLYFAANAGGGTVVDGFEANTMNAAVSAAIGGAGDSGAVPRFFNNMWLSGHTMDLSGLNDTFVSNSYVRKILFSSASSNYYIGNTRFASSGDPIAIEGAGGMFDNCAFAGPVTVQNASGVSFNPSCDFGFGFTQASTAVFISAHLQHAAYTAAWTQPAGIQPAIGNGSIKARAIRSGRVCYVQIEIALGSTTTPGNNASAYQVSLPWLATSDVSAVQNIVSCAQIKCAGLFYTAGVQVAPDDSVATLVWNESGVRESNPGAFANGDFLKLNFSYLTR